MDADLHTLTTSNGPTTRQLIIGPHHDLPACKTLSAAAARPFTIATRAVASRRSELSLLAALQFGADIAPKAVLCLSRMIDRLIHYSNVDRNI